MKYYMIFLQKNLLKILCMRTIWNCMKGAYFTQTLKNLLYVWKLYEIKKKYLYLAQISCMKIVWNVYISLKGQSASELFKIRQVYLSLHLRVKNALAIICFSQKYPLTIQTMEKIIPSNGCSKIKENDLLLPSYTSLFSFILEQPSQWRTFLTHLNS